MSFSCGVLYLLRVLSLRAGDMLVIRSTSQVISDRQRKLFPHTGVYPK